ncbi:MAG: radical SAM protein [Candidatus Azobacteroides sp.]|nr:radical SAM protein [Candidatus Azobacteroides sp.]
MKKRIRIDNLGMITQDDKGRIACIDMAHSEVKKYEVLSMCAVKNKLSQRKDLDLFVFPNGTLDADIDVCIDWNVNCLTRPLRHYYGIEPYCDLSCSFCGPRKLRFDNYRRHSEYETFLLREIAASGAFQVQLTGGEIFLRAERLFDTIEYCRELGLGVLLATNGLWSRIKDKKSFAKNLSYFDNIIEVKVSIDGNEPFHDQVRRLNGSYRAAVDTVRHLTEYGLPTRINTTIFKDSCEIGFIEHVANIAKTYGASLQAIPERACGRSLGRDVFELPSKEKLRIYSQRAKELRDELQIPISFNFDILGGGRILPNYDRERPFSCGAGLWGFAITHEREIYPCGFSIESGGEKRFLVGKVEKQGDMLDIWLNSPVLHEWRQAEKCFQCRMCNHYKKECWGGCKVQAFMINGSLSAPDPYCFA